MAAAGATYIYGVLDAGEEPRGITGIGGAPLREVVNDGIAALVSELPGDELILGRDEMTTHARVLEAALQQGTVLPMRFGVVMDGDTAVRRDLLEAHREELQRQLAELSGKVELRVRAIYDEQRLMREVLADDPELARMRDSLRGVPEDAAHFRRIQLGEMVADAVSRRREADADWIMESLLPLALDAEVTAPAHERVVVSASFLLEATRVPAFDRAVDDLGRAQAERMRFRYTGPLPPHSFVELRTEG
jgi:hypothetical protein